MPANLYIPKKIKVGFQKRTDTFTGKLAYITYFDEKNKLRKEESWLGWCDKKIPYIELDNEPMKNFILNKGVQRDGYWGTGRSVIRVYDHRDFEFEIGVDNLIGILMHSDVSKRDISESCVYAWNGKNLVLLPTNSEEYKAAVEYSSKQDKKISSKEFKPGLTFGAKKNSSNYVYIGHHQWFQMQQVYDYNQGKTQYNHENKGKKHIFWDGTGYVYKEPSFFSHVVSDEPVSNYAHLVDGFFATVHSQSIVGLTVKKATKDVYGNLFSLDKDKTSGKLCHKNSEWIGGDNYFYFKFAGTFKATLSEESIFEVSNHRHHQHSYMQKRELPKDVLALEAPVAQQNNSKALAELYEKYQIGTLYFILKNGAETASLIN